MRPIHSKGRRRAAIASALLAMCLALPAAASADTTAGGTGAAHVSISADVHVSAKVLATVNVSFTCDPFLIYDWQTGESVPSTVGHLEFGGVSLTQAQGRSVASGGGDFEGGTVVCDGSTVTTLAVPVMATTFPWKSGTAIASARVNVYSDTFESRDFGETGAVIVKLGK